MEGAHISSLERRLDNAEKDERNEDADSGTPAAKRSCDAEVSRTFRIDIIP
jgi:hypothetical protein